MDEIVIIGTGGHAREVCGILQSGYAHGRNKAVVGWLTDDQTLHGTHLYGLPILGSPAWLIDHPHLATIIAIGNNSIRRAITQRLPTNQRYAQAISPQAVVSAQTQLPPGIMLFPYTVIGPDVQPGAHTILNVGASISHDSTTADWVNINPGARIAGNCQLGQGAYIGMGASIIQGVQVGDWTTVGAGAVVVRDLPAHVTAVGVPAKVIKAHEPQPR